MNTYWAIIIAVIGFSTLVLAIVAIRVVIKNKCLTLVQRIAYIFLSCFIPIIGPYTALHFISQYYSSEDLRSIVPWPIYLFLLVRPHVPNKNKSEFDDYGGF
jgi:hypothetical protein